MILSTVHYCLRETPREGKYYSEYLKGFHKSYVFILLIRLHMWKLMESLEQRQRRNSTPEMRSNSPPPSSPSPTLPSPLQAHVSKSLMDSWSHPAMPCALTDPLGQPPYPDITCGLYLPLFGRLACGRSDGTIASFSATQAATLLLLKPRKFHRGQY